MLSDLSTDAAVLLNFESSAQLYCLVLVLGNVISMHPCRSALLRRFTSRAEDGVQILAHLKKAVFGSFERRALLTLFGTEYDTCETLGRYPTRSTPNSAPAHETHTSTIDLHLLQPRPARPFHCVRQLAKLDVLYRSLACERLR
jgi:hypothetical protein